MYSCYKYIYDCKYRLCVCVSVTMFANGSKSEKPNLLTPTNQPTISISLILRDILFTLIPLPSSQVIDPRAENGAVSGWCLGVKTTLCSSSVLLPSSQGTRVSDEIRHGCYPFKIKKNRAKKYLCFYKCQRIKQR